MMAPVCRVYLGAAIIPFGCRP